MSRREQESYFIVLVHSSSVSLHMFCLAWIIVLPSGCRPGIDSHLSILGSIVRSAERLYEGELCCLGHRMKVSA